jgi:hypothetical protein
MATESAVLLHSWAMTGGRIGASSSVASAAWNASNAVEVEEGISSETYAD